MPLLRLNEHYISVQGEGPNVGKLTQFVRFSGCNMRCPGWPCDTQHAIEPALYRNDPKVAGTDVLGLLQYHYINSGARHVCITGGEPFMQDKLMLKHVVMDAVSQLNMTVDIFTNGSFEFPSWITYGGITVVMDWKLPGSGEHMTAIEQRRFNADMLRAKDAIKFVVKDETDLMVALETAKQFAAEWSPHTGMPRFYVGRVWDAELTDDQIVQWLQQNQLDWYLNVQMHKYIWPGVERGI